jgi:hypothetical protein
MSRASHAKISCMPIIRNRRAVVAKWIFGRDAFSKQQYVVHTEYPAFFAKIGQEADGKLSTFRHEIRPDQNLFDFVWLDPFPGGAQFLSVIHEAEIAFDAHLSRCRSN